MENRSHGTATKLRKHFLWGVGEDSGTAAGFYIWPSIEAAKRAHNNKWRETVKARTGSYPSIRYFDMMAIVDNERGTTRANGKAFHLWAP